MKILFVSDVFVRHGGGAPNVMFEVGKKLVASGHQVAVLTFQHKRDWPMREDISGIQVWRTPLKTSWLPFYFSGYKNMQELACRVLKEFVPDVINVHMPFSGHAAMSKMPSNIPLIYTFHASWAEEYLVEARTWKKRSQLFRLEYLYMRYLERSILRRAQKVLTLSRFMQERAQKYRIEPEQGWDIFPSGVELERFSPKDDRQKNDFRDRKKIPAGSFFVLCIRRLTQRMGIESLVEAISIVRREIPSIYLVIGGKGEIMHKLKIMISTLDLRGIVRLEGFIADEELAEYYASADLFVLPTQALEGFGLISLEAMASGTPVLATPVGANPEVVGSFHEDFMLAGTTPKDIAQGIIQYYRNYYQDGDHRLRIEAREYAEQFSWDRMAKSYLQTYQNAFDGRKEETPGN